MGSRNPTKKLAKFVSYVLGRRPDEFGLVPDAEGFVKIKDFLKAVCEETGWKYVRRGHINELLLTLADPSVEIRNNLIRATDRDHLPEKTPAENPPKTLYVCVRKRAYPHVHKKGLLPPDTGHLILSSNREKALRIGQRTDREPVLITVHVTVALKRGVSFFQSGADLYLTESIPPDCFSGPSLPKQKPEQKNPPSPPEQATVPQPGSFFMDMSQEQKVKRRGRKKGQKKEISWKKNRKHSRR